MYSETELISRRRLLLSLPVLMMAPRAFAQPDNPPIRVRGINHVTLSVSDVRRSVDFYQGLFGMPVTSRQGMTTNLQIGAGPQFLGVSAASSAHTIVIDGRPTDARAGLNFALFPFRPTRHDSTHADLRLARGRHHHGLS